MNNSHFVVFKLAKQKLLLLVAVLASLMAIVNITSGLFPALLQRRHLLSIVLSQQWQTGSRLMTIFIGFLLLSLVNQLLNHKKVAWWLTETLLLISIFTHLGKGLDFEEASLSFVTFIILIPLKSLFYAKSDPVYLKSIPKRAAISAIVLFAYGLIGLIIIGNNRIDWLANLKNIASSLFLLNYPASIHGQHMNIFINSLYLLGISWYIHLLLLVLSPVLIRQHPSAKEKRVVEKLVNQYSPTSLSCAALLNDKLYFFPKCGSVVIIYVLQAGVALVLGEPIGPVGKVAESIAEFASFTQKNSWLLAFYQVRPQFVEIFQQQHFKLLPIGEEGILDLTHFSLEGSQGKEFRYSQHKLEKKRYTAKIVFPPHNRRLLAQLKIVSQAWLKHKHLKEMTFSVGNFDYQYLADKPLAILYDPQGQIVAFISLLLNQKESEVGIDLMRFLPHLPNAAMDYLFTTTLLQAKNQHYYTFNFALSPLSGVGQEKTDHWLNKALHFIFQHVGVFYNFRGLHSFKQKFHPDWSVRYLAYQKDLHLTKVGLALLKAHQKKLN